MSKVIFCNWAVNSKYFHSINLLEAQNLIEYDLIFFDPIGFALSNGFRNNLDDLWAKEFIQIIENEYHNYLKRLKRTIDELTMFFNAGGILIIRSIFPNSYINVRKKGSSSMGQYTKTIISPFSWLEVFLGKYSFRFSPENKIYFTDKKSVLYEYFNNTPVISPQTQTSLPQGDVKVIAVNNEQNGLPVISRVQLTVGSGEIYLIPKFLVNDEIDKLVEAFNAIKKGQETREYRPAWVGEYEQSLVISNPLIRTIDEINREIGKLESKKKALQKRNDMVKLFINLLFKSGDELTEIVKNTFQLIGFYSPEMPTSAGKAAFHFYMRDKDAFHIVGRISSTTDGPVETDEIQQLSGQINSAYKKDKPKGILVSNADYMNAPSKRPARFSDELVERNKLYDFCLITTETLFDIVCYLIDRSESENIDKVSQSLRRDIINCSDIFVFNRKKFLSPA